MTFRTIPIHLLLLGALSLTGTVQAQGYTLDASCSGDAKTKVDSAMKVAFGYANSAARALNTNPIDSEVQKVYNYLFINGLDGQTDVRDTKVKPVFEDIWALRNPIDKQIRNPDTVIVYCNFDRLKPIKDKPDFFYDSDIDADVDYSTKESKDSLARCKSPNPGKARTMAYAVNGNKLNPRATQIQICPWYLDHSFHKKFDESKGYMMKRISAYLWEHLWDKWTDTQIDGLADFPVTMLHELAHTKYAGHRGLFGGTSGDELGYGWKSITENPARGHVNADNYAYFALATDLMRVVSDPKTVQADGKLVPKPSPLQKLKLRMVRGMQWFG